MKKLPDFLDQFFVFGENDDLVLALSLCFLLLRFEGVNILDRQKCVLRWLTLEETKIRVKKKKNFITKTEKEKL